MRFFGALNSTRGFERPLSADACTACARGTRQAEPGVACSACAPGKHAPETGSVTCLTTLVGRQILAQQRNADLARHSDTILTSAQMILRVGKIGNLFDGRCRSSERVSDLKQNTCHAGCEERLQ